MSIVSSLFIVFFYTLSAHVSNAQFQLYPHYQGEEVRNANHRTKEVEAMSLPFWDDFSFAGKAGDTLWLYKDRTRIVDGMGILPPSIGVAVMDGLDSLGSPYETDLTANGFTDMLVSRPLRLKDIPPANRDSVYISFMYQWKGNGEAPDPADYLQVDFRDSTNTWVPISLLRVTVSPDPTVFLDYIQKIEGKEFFHNNFQFRISRYGRRSGAFDTWIVDYVYVNEHRFATDFSFPDRSVSSGLTSLFGEYRAVPKDHFLLNKVVTAPRFVISTQKNAGTPLNENSYLESVNFYEDTPNTPYTQPLDVGYGLSLTAFGKLEESFQVLPDFTSPMVFDPLADSIRITLRMVLTSSDNVYDRYPAGHPLEDLDEPNADYDSSIYYPIDFRSNDTTQATYILSNYYAYDDGVAEYSVGLAQAGNKAAFRFTQAGNDGDTLTGAYIYFPKLAGTLSSIMNFQVYDDSGLLPNTLLGEEVVTVQRAGLDVFHRINLKNSIFVQKEFYIGWEQPQNGTISIGLDRSVDHSDKLFSNSNGTWLPSSNVTGTIMIRPIFGSGKIITSLPESRQALSLYPNPVNNNRFTTSERAEVISVTTSTGQAISFTQQKDVDKTQVYLHTSTIGLVFVKLLVGNEVITYKILLQ